MGERLLCKQEVIGSIPFTSTTGVAQQRRELPARWGSRQAQRSCAERRLVALPGTLAKMRVCGRQSLAMPMGEDPSGLARDG